MHSKTSDLFKILDEIGFWQEGIGYKDMYGQKNILIAEEKYAKLHKYIIQTEDRLYLLEWLLKRYQKDIFDKYNEDKADGSYYNDNIERIQRIKDIFLDLGIFWTNKYTKTLDYAKVVEGIAGSMPSFHIIYVLAKFVKESMKPTKAKDEVEGFDTLTELISNNDALINQKLNLFPIDFPCQYDLTYEEIQKEIFTLKDEYQERLNQFEDLVLKYQEKCSGTEGFTIYAGETVKDSYSKALNKFRIHLSNFLEEYKLKRFKVKNMISRMESNKILIPSEFPDAMDNVSKKQAEIQNFNKLLERADLNERIEALEADLEKLLMK